MIAKLFDRLVYSIIGLIFGALVAVAVWVFLHYERLGVTGDTVFDGGFVTWLKIVAATFAVIGFVAKDQVGGAIGGTLDVACRTAIGQTSSEGEVPTWLVVVVVVGVGALAWHFGRG